MRKQLLLFPFLAIAATAFAQTSTGFQSPTATTAPNGWTNPANAYASDDVYTTVAHQSGCRCPFLYLSWDGGMTYTSPQLVGPFLTTDQTMIAGSPTNNWGHTWTAAEFSTANFVFKIANPSTLIEQGYNNFNFAIPVGATIDGIEVQVEEHGDSAFTMEFIDLIQVNVYYTSPNGIETYRANELWVYPNPASDFLHVINLPEHTNSVFLLDVTGRKVMEQNEIAEGQEVTIALEGLPKGVYFLGILAEDRTISKKVVVQ